VKIDWSFLRLVLICFTCTAALTYYPISEFATKEVMHSIIAGSIMSLANLLLGYIRRNGRTIDVDVGSIFTAHQGI